MQEYTIYPLVVGINETDQGVMTYLRDYGKRIYLPIYVFYLKGGNKHILVDTGLEQFMVPDGAEKQCGFKINDKNFPSTGPAIAPGVHINLADAYDSIQKIKKLADILIPLHDPSMGRRKTIP
jgi:hypothetical protein